MAELLKRLIVSTRPNVHIDDLKIKLRKTGDAIDLIGPNFDGTPIRTVDEVGASRDLDNAIANGYVNLFDQNGTQLTGLAALQATNLATLRDTGVESVGVSKSGLEAVSNASNTVTVTFFSPFATADYGVSGLLVNTSDSPPSIYSWIVEAKSTTAFTVLFSGVIDSGSYQFAWNAHLSV